MDFKNYMNDFKLRIEFIENLFNDKNLILMTDKLNNEKNVDHELLYFRKDKTEEKGIFIYGYRFFIKELSEQEFKKSIGFDSLNLRIYKAYHNLSKIQSKIKISDILNDIQNRRKDSLELNRILNRILSLAYYLNWNIIKDLTDLEGDFIIKADIKFLRKLKQRFDLTPINSVYEDENLFIFMNAKAKLSLVFKNLNKFNKNDLNKFVLPVIKKIFSLKKVEFME